MRHNYHTRALVLARSPLGETSALITILTPDLGLLRARVQGIRKSSAKLAPALATFAESGVVVVRGKEGWRVTGASLDTLWHRRLSHEARVRAGRVASLLLRLAPRETPGENIFSVFSGLLAVLAEGEEDAQDAAECLAALRILATFGLDAGEVPGEAPGDYAPTLLESVAESRTAFVIRINRGITASGL